MKGATDALSRLMKSRPVKKHVVKEFKPPKLAAKSSKKEVKEYDAKLKIHSAKLAEYEVKLESYLKEKAELEILQSSRGTFFSSPFPFSFLR